MEYLFHLLFSQNTFDVLHAWNVSALCNKNTPYGCHCHLPFTITQYQSKILVKAVS